MWREGARRLVAAPGLWKLGAAPVAAAAPGPRQQVRWRSQRWSLGKPPGQARSLEQRLHQMKALGQSALNSPLDIGFARTPANRKEQSAHRLDVLKRNKALAQTLPPGHISLVDLEEVRREWREGGAGRALAAARHYSVFSHLFGDGAFFHPVVRLHITYPGGYPVFWGNLLTPTQAGKAPEVEFEGGGKDSLWTLALTTPDGHLTKPESEYVLWLVGNIKGGDVGSGQEVVPYSQPLPLRGLGACRYVFVLYKQHSPLDFSTLAASQWSKLEERDFSTHEFYGARQGELTPAGLAFFQSEWDESVRAQFHTVYRCQEPSTSYDFPPHYHPRQTWFPLRLPFNLYMDRYRDEKQIAKEYLVRRLKGYSPWTGPAPRLHFPNAVPFKPNTPSWLKNEIRKSRLGKARSQDY